MRLSLRKLPAAVFMTGRAAFLWTGLAAFWATGFVAASAAAGQVASSPDAPARPVVLLHGLLRSSSSMNTLADALGKAGFRVCNVDYPSRHHPIEVLAVEYVAPAVGRCFPGETGPVDFVTHSMGGIVVRQIAARGLLPAIGRVVMLGPPNGGSELVDEFADWRLFRSINGPAGAELGTTPESTARRLGPATFEVGIIAGSRSLNLVLSSFLPGEDDGKVSVRNAALEGMKDFVVMPATHTFMMRNEEVIAQALHFLRQGSFARPTETARASGAPSS